MIENDEMNRLVARRTKLTLINVAGILIILAGQLLLTYFKLLSPEVMMCYPLLIFVWGSVMITLLIRNSLCIKKLCSKIITQIKDRHDVREPRLPE